MTELDADVAAAVAQYPELGYWAETHKREHVLAMAARLHAADPDHLPRQLDALRKTAAFLRACPEVYADASAARTTPETA